MKRKFSREYLFDTFDQCLVFLWLAVAARFVPESSWIGDCIHQARFSLISFKGIYTRGILNRFMPSLRRSYFVSVFGPEHVLAKSSKANVQLPQGYDNEFVLSQLLHFECNAGTLMLRFLASATFEDINAEKGTGFKILFWAARNGYLSVVQKLIYLGINTDIVIADDNPGFWTSNLRGSALFWAAQAGHDKVVDILLLQGAKIQNDSLDWSPLVGATRGSHNLFDEDRRLPYVKCVSLLLQAGANPSAADKQGRSALSWSTKPTQKPILDRLLRAGADANAIDQKLKLPLHYAAWFSASQGVVRALLPKTTDAGILTKMDRLLSPALFGVAIVFLR